MQNAAYQVVEPAEVRELLGELGPVTRAQMQDEVVQGHQTALLGVVRHLAVADLGDDHGQRPDVRTGRDLRGGQVHQDLRGRPVDVSGEVIEYTENNKSTGVMNDESTIPGQLARV